MRMKKHLAEEKIVFDGRQLQQGWIREQFGIQGEAIIAFVGPFRPKIDTAVFPRGYDRFADHIMLHFVVEHKHRNPEMLRLQQQLLINVTKDKLNHRLKGDIVQRWRQDLCRNSAHITTSAALLTKISSLIYLGANVSGEEKRSKLWGLQDGGIDAGDLAQAVMDQYIFEIESARRPVD